MSTRDTHLTNDPTFLQSCNWINSSLIGGVIIILLGSCSSYLNSEDDTSRFVTASTPIRTSSNTYQVQNESVEIPAKYVNQTGTAIVVDWCSTNIPGFRLQKKIDQEWVKVYSSFCLGGVKPTVYSAGDSFATTVELSVAVRYFDAERVPGKYRLMFSRIHYYSEDGPSPDGTWNNELPIKKRVSNPFTIAK